MVLVADFIVGKRYLAAKWVVLPQTADIPNKCPVHSQHDNNQQFPFQGQVWGGLGGIAPPDFSWAPPKYPADNKIIKNGNNNNNLITVIIKYLLNISSNRYN